MTDQLEIIEFMRRFSFATIISNKENVPIATHLPFIIERIDGALVLISHFAKGNEHWKYLENQPVLVVFSEPHAYISTSNYEKELNVPTWNYLSVHAYGNAEIIINDFEMSDLLQKTIKTYDNSFGAKWDEFPANYKERLTNGIVGFKLTVYDLQAKKKLSQNRTETEKNKIINSLAESTHANEKLIAEYMEKEKNKTSTNH